MHKTQTERLRQEAIQAAVNYYKIKHAPQKEFQAGDKIPYAGRVFAEKEIANLIDASLDFWLTAGKYAAQFEAAFAQFLQVKYVSLTNSGSSANLLAFMALTSPQLGERRIQKGDEVITVAAGFPTTVAPIIQYGAVPVFVDVSLPQYNIDPTTLTAALSAKTKAVMLAHTLGNPFSLKTVKEFCDKYNLWLIEDNCDALGAEYLLEGKWRYTGTIGHIGTSSFYPPHHMTMGEGGAVYTNDAHLKRLIESFRDWGRDCWCPPGKDNTCQNRFNRQFTHLPPGYDHKYVYSHFGYNLKITDLQAAIGCAQLEKLPGFIQKRNQNWARLRAGLDRLQDVFILPEPAPHSKPSWFGFLLTLRPESKISRDAIVQQLEKHGIQTRMLFAGNLLKQPCFDELRADPSTFRVAGSLENSDLIMQKTFWLGVYPGLDEARINFMIKTLTEIVSREVF
ncbi:MAG: lipopolysaccharide biosynthesis protein RfbH [Sporomusaceae bacterium]|jgi:CDP-6-deoxy-D-xylo-4-hexulose-3-dehydrase|nr:lipopolysaccharide biosynthesis protein RfbH [Sporomusaceae bacterium]